MKHRRLILLLAFILTLIDVLRETGVINLNFYRSSINSNTATNWTNTSFINNDNVGCPEPNDSNLDDAEKTCIPMSASQISLIIYIANKSYRDNSDSCSILIFNVSNKNHGLFWTPLYKDVKFSASATCNQSLTIRDKSSGYRHCKHYQLSGIITISGSIRVTGICSYHEVKKLIQDALANIVLSQGRTQLENL